jgi:ferredoxin
MLKKLRVAIALILFCLLTFFFIDFANILSNKFHVLGHIQLIPALLAVNLLIILCIFVFTLLFGRIYCSTVCPMGTFQDIIGRFSKLAKKKKKKHIYRKNNWILRCSVAAIVMILFLLGNTLLLGILDPYSAYGRMTVHLFKPVYLFANNILASIFNSFGNYTFYKMEILTLGAFSLIVSASTLLIIGVLAWTSGRLYCNTICPVGTVLGFLSKFSLFRIKINDEKCVSCGVCSQKCKASCIDTQAKTIDYSRCVNCFNCMGSCDRKGISFSLAKRKSGQLADEKKRQFLLTGLAATIGIPAALAQKNKGLLTGGSENGRQTAISPPGSISAEHLQKHCTACHLCVSKCPSKVLKPAFLEYGIGGMMQPVMSFEKGFCNYNCTRCSKICPNGAILPLTKEQKHLTQVGRVVFRAENCVVHAMGYNCGACSEHCPTQAVKMMPYKDGLTIPYIDPDICIGCGGCEFICPARPHAIYVEGNEIQQQAKPFDKEEKTDMEITDFGF